MRENSSVIPSEMTNAISNTRLPSRPGKMQASRIETPIAAVITRLASSERGAKETGT